MSPDASTPPLIDDELDVLADMVPLAGQHVVELGCGAAHLSRSLLARHADSRVTGLEVDERQHDHRHRTARDKGVAYLFESAQRLLEDFFSEVDLVIKEAQS